MSFYKIYPLKVPNGDWCSPYKINDNQFVAGRCGNKAILWKPNRNFQLLNLPGTSHAAFSLNSLQNVVGITDGQPFIWEQSTGVTTLLKGFNGQLTHGSAIGINDLNQITGRVFLPDQYRDYPAIWNTSNAIPINLFAGAGVNPGESGHGIDISNHGLVVGERYDYAAPPFPSFNQSFIWDNNIYNAFVNKNLIDVPNYVLHSVNDLLRPQIVGNGRYLDSVTFDIKPIFYDTQTALLQILAIPGEEGYTTDINNDADAVGGIKTIFEGIGGVPQSAVLWKFNGLVRINLNHPSISDAQANGWHLDSATSINNKGYIVGSGFLNDDKRTHLPWLLKPIIPIHKIPIEYMLPQALWPGQAHDGPIPRTWPLKFPFPIPSPNPFQIVGNAYTHLNNILISKNVKETTNLMSDSKARNKIQTIADQTIKEEMKKLKIILSERSALAKKGEKKGNISVKRKK